MRSALFSVIAVFISLFMISMVSCAQSKDQKKAAIRQEFQKINRDSSLRSATLDDPEEFLGHATDGGGELTGYFKEDTVCKIILTIGLSYGEVKDEYYFKNGRLIFVYETEKNFASDSLGTNHEKLNSVFEGRYYFDNNKLLDKIEKGNRRFEKDNTPAVLLKDAADYVRLVSAKRK